MTLKRNGKQLYNRLISGNVYLEYNNNIFCIRPPSNELRQRAELHYDSIIKQYRFSGIMDEETLIRVCINRNIIDKDYKKLLEKIQEDIKNLKIKLFMSQMKPSTVKDIKYQLSQKRIQAGKIGGTLSIVSRNSIEGLARFCQNHFIFLESIFLNNNKYSGSDVTLLNHLSYNFGTITPTEEEIREIARSVDWRTIWGAEKHKIFTNHISELSDEQRVMMHFSYLYDFAYEHERCPPDSVFEDDDMFDGWYLYQIEKSKKAKKEKKEEDDNAMVKEVFYMAKDQEEANNYYAMNSEESRNILKQRAAQLNAGGKIKDHQFKDIQQDLSMMMEAKMTQHVKGNLK